jgi:peptidoglycan hydrolase-like protein with peptidoglycan-binding domain
MQPTQERYTEIQQALTDRGYYDGPLNGVWNQECVQALKKFQQDEKLSPDGKLGALSLIALGLGPKREVASEFNAKPEVAP